MYVLTLSGIVRIQHNLTVLVREFRIKIMVVVNLHKRCHFSTSWWFLAGNEQ